MSKILVLLAVSLPFAFSQSASAQGATAASAQVGTVKAGSQPIPGATVRATQGDRSLVTLTGDNGLAWEAAVLRPELFLWEQWAVVTGGDPVQTAINRARRHGPNFDLVRQIIVKGADVLEIYERDTAPSNLVHPPDADSIR